MYNSTYLESDLVKFKSARDDFKKLRRQKQKDYYDGKKMGDFKNNKLFWHCFSKSIKIKSDKTDIDVPTSFVEDGRVIDDPAEVANMFNSFFTNLSSTSNACYEDSKTFIKVEEKLSTSKFSFVPTTSTIVEKLILKLDNASSPGPSGIPTKILKAASNSLAPLLAKLFNN